MESALNKAHQLERKAEKLLRANKFDEAIACHQETAELLLEAMKLTNVDKALESVKLQRDHNLRQQGIIRYRKALIQKVSTMHKQAVKFATDVTRGPLNTGVALGNLAKASDLQHALYSHIEETDSLLRGLVSGRSATPDALGTSPDMTRAVFKKEDKVVIEELHTKNEALRALVDRLVNELSALQMDNDQLRGQLRLRDMERDFLLQQQRRRERPLRVTTTTPDEDGSPFSALSPFVGDDLDDDPSLDSGELPPLEMPTFDYESFQSSRSTLSSFDKTQGSG